MNGYQVDFLDGLPIPLPTFSHEIADEVLKNVPALREGMIADYIHYSVVMNHTRTKRSPLFVALNIDQNRLKASKRSNRWRTDSRIAFENQLNNDYYANNPWDKGHMARRTSAAWGDAAREAQRAADETFYYTNSCIQHENLNQDEWQALEDWVYSLDLDADGRISSFSGPFYGDHDRSIRPGGRPLALIPSGFFKVVCFKNRDTQQLDVRAFVMYQDEQALQDKQGRKRYNNQTYQATVTEIEELTGLLFDDSIVEANPLYFAETHATEDENVLETPERHELGRPEDILKKGDRRQTVKDDIVDIFIASAMVNPQGNDRDREWISIINLGSLDVDISGWTFRDNADHSLEIDSLLPADKRIMMPGESRVIGPVQPMTLNNAGDIIKLYDRDGARIDWVNYTAGMVDEGVAVVFLSPRDTLDQALVS